MNSRPALHKPQPPRTPEPRARQPDNSAASAPAQSRSERNTAAHSDTRRDSELFESLLDASPATATWLGSETAQGFNEPWQDHERQGGGAPGAEPALAYWWENLLETIETQLTAQQQIPVEAVLELPVLGQVRVQVADDRDGLAITLRFDDPAAWRHCRETAEHSRTCLSERLSRPVRLTLEQAGQ